MTIFVVFRVSNPDALRSRIQQEFPADHLEMQDDEWLIAADLTAEDVSARLGITTSETSTAIIFAMRSYFGRAPTNIWDWIKTKAEKKDG